LQQNIVAYRVVFEDLPEANWAWQLGVYAVTLDPYFPYMQ